MRVSTFKSEAMVLCREMVDCSLQVGSELPPQAILFINEGKIEQETDKQIGAASAVIRTIVGKRELSRKPKLAIYQSIYVPSFTYGQ